MFQSYDAAGFASKTLGTGGLASTGGVNPAATYQSVATPLPRLSTHPCFRLDFPLTALGLAFSDGYFLDLSLDSSFRSDGLVELFA